MSKHGIHWYSHRFMGHRSRCLSLATHIVTTFPVLGSQQLVALWTIPTRITSADLFSLQVHSPAQPSDLSRWDIRHLGHITPPQKSRTQKSQSLQFLSVFHRFSRKMQVLHLELLTVVIWKSATGQVKFRPSTPRTCVARWTSTWTDTPGLSGKREKHVMRKQLGYIQRCMIYIYI